MDPSVHFWIDERRETVGVDAGDYCFRWICPFCGKHGGWHFAERSAAHGGKVHYTRMHAAERALEAM